MSNFTVFLRKFVYLNKQKKYKLTRMAIYIKARVDKLGDHTYEKNSYKKKFKETRLNILTFF